jgi:hypothetical protein
MFKIKDDEFLDEEELYEEVKKQAIWGHLKPEDKFKAMYKYGEPGKVYYFVVVEQADGKQMLLSKGYNQNWVLGSVEERNESVQCWRKVYQPAEVTFVEFFFTPVASFGMDSVGSLWIIGGDFPLKEPEVFGLEESKDGG